MAPCGSLWMNGRWKLAQTSWWHEAHCALISGALRATRPFGPFLWMAWHATQDTWFFAWLLVMRPTCVGWLRWQVRQILSACAGGSLPGLRMSAADVDSACLLPGPWHDSQALFSKPRF